ncbi:MAG: ATP-binding protein [Pseudomonadota bacterium]
MFADPQALLQRIKLGEDSTLELKEVRVEGGRVIAPHRNGLADEFAAFANARGGVCVLGVEDGTRRIVGIEPGDLDRVEQHVQSACHDLIDPPLAPHIERFWLTGDDGQPRAVIKVEVPRSLFVHRSPEGYLQRSGSTRRQLRSEQLARLFQQRSQTGLIRFDEEIIGDAKLDDLNTALWRRFKPAHSREAKAVLLGKLGMARQDEAGVWRPTVSGVLMACEDPRRFLPHAWIQAVAYRGNTPVPEDGADFYQIDAKDIVGPLDAQATEACRFVARNMKVAARKRLGRRDFPQYDLTAVFEAVVNAVVHRDYSIHGAKIRLRLFADRLELYSPGGLPNTLEPDSLPYRQVARNETLASLLARCPIPSEAGWIQTTRTTFMDRRGEGVPVILARSKALSGKTPEYRLIDDSELLLTIYGADISEPKI